MTNPLLAALLFAVGILLSAFFSGAETGFYRVTRLRLILDGRAGDWVARGLLWLTNNPAVFVATTLIGNNIANYLVSLSIVVGVQWLPFSGHDVLGMIAPMLLAPVIFVYGELLPKNLFFHAPNLLLRRVGPMLFLCAVCFAPISLFLAGLGQILQWMLGETPLQLRLTLARKELDRVLQEGEDAGVLESSQRKLAHSVNTIGAKAVSEIRTPVSRVAAVPLGASKAEALRIAKRHHASFVTICDQSSRKLLGYVRVIDLCFTESSEIKDMREFLVAGENESLVSTMIRMQTERVEVARVMGKTGETLGIVSRHRLQCALFHGE